MPITSVSFTFENGVKREEYGPTRKASATIVYGVDDNENGEAVLAHIAHVARHRVQDSIGAAQPPALQPTPAEAQAAGRADADIAPSPQSAAPTAEPGSDTSGSATDASTTSAEATPGQPSSSPPPSDGAKRTRRTKEQIAADKAREEAEKTAKDPQVQSEGLPLGQPETPADAGERVITNEELTQACAAAAQRAGDPAPVKAAVAKYADPPFVANILSAQRPAFLAELEAIK